MKARTSARLVVLCRARSCAHAGNRSRGLIGGATVAEPSAAACASTRRPVTMSAVLEGTSSDLPAMGRPKEVPQSRETGAPMRSGEPRPEIWFKRRVSLFSALKELWDFRELTVTLAERDIRVRYKQAALGIVWAVITPLVMMLAFTLLFNRFAKVNTGGAPYALFS